MSYDIYFLRRRPGQSWDDAMDTLEEDDEDDAEPSRPERWDQVVAGVRALLGDVTVADGPPDWEIDDQQTAIQVSCYAGEWSMTVPYWYDGERAEAIAGQLLAIARLICGATGLEAYDPQTGQEVTSSAWTPASAATVFDQVAESFNRRGIR